METLTWQGWFTLTVVGLMIVGLVRFEYVADVIFLGATAVLCMAGIITSDEALAGFKNEGMLTVAALFVVAAGLTETGFMRRVAGWILGGESSGRRALARVTPMTAAASAFLNNTTVVAMLMPPLLEWSRRNRIAPSRLLLPLSYAAVIGGVCTLIGTSTNLVVHGMMQSSGVPGFERGMGMWELSKVGIPIAAIGTLYLIFVVPKILPDRKEFLEQLGESRREYLAEVSVDPASPLIGKNVQDAGLRGLPGLFLIEIEREGRRISPVSPEEVLAARDRLVFTGVVSTILDLQKFPGLMPSADSTFEIDPMERRGKRLCEAVISVSSPLVGQGIRAANFRTIYDAAVVAVHRNGKRLRKKIGDVVLEPGDTLLLETGGDFALAHRNNPDFYLVSQLAEDPPVRHSRATIAALIAGAMVVAMTLPEIMRWLPVPASWSDWCDSRRAIFAICAAGLMVVTRCVSSPGARRSIEWSVLLIIAGAFGVGAAMSKSGVAAFIAHHTISLLQSMGPVAILAGIYFLTWLLTELMSNNAAAALMFPIAVATAKQAGCDPRAFVIAIAVAASMGFMFPAGYQTHLMVFGPGGYKLSDFLKAGAPLVLVSMVVSVACIAMFWPLAMPR